MAIREDEKLSKFLLAINEYAENQRSKIMDEVEERNREELKKAEHDVLSESYVMIQNEIGEMRGDIRRKISQAETNAKNSLIQERISIENKVFSEVAEKLAAFSKTEQYCDVLRSDAKKLNEIFSDNCDGSSIVVYLKSDDLKFAQELKNIFGQKCDIIADESIKLGGLRVFSKKQNRVADSTFDRALIDKHEWFAENSGLSVNIN